MGLIACARSGNWKIKIGTVATLAPRDGWGNAKIQLRHTWVGT